MGLGGLFCDSLVQGILYDICQTRSRELLMFCPLFLLWLQGRGGTLTMPFSHMLGSRKRAVCCATSELPDCDLGVFL